ncbi:MAG: zinc-ribbon domain-containing protein [Acidobacteriota bacterium]|nr:zinc-ribbon domain-containing protein [Acidobacteriota bacterium]
MIRITCTNCQKPLSLDETKLPMREVAFPCPVCKAKLTVDRRNFESGETAPAENAPAPAPPPPQAAPQPPSQVEEDNHEDDFGAKALIVGADHPALRHAAKLIGYLPVHHAEPAKAREFFNQELPHVVFLNPPQLTAPPFDWMSPMVSVVPSDRRKTFFILVADNLRTFDGNAAFLYGVNLVVATKDLPQFPQIFRDAHAAHERLYAGMTAVLREREKHND